MPLLRRPTELLLRALLLAALGLTAAGASAATLRVPADQPTIQAAVDAAAPGDLVLVSAGDYFESVTIAGRSDLRIESEDGPWATSNRSPGLEPSFRVTDSDNIVASSFIADRAPER